MLAIAARTRSTRRLILRQRSCDHISMEDRSIALLQHHRGTMPDEDFCQMGADGILIGQPFSQAIAELQGPCSSWIISNSFLLPIAQNSVLL